MLAEIYIEVLLGDEDLADQVWEAWDKGKVDDDAAFIVGQIDSQKADLAGM